MVKSDLIRMLKVDNLQEIQDEGIRIALMEEDLSFIMYYSFDPLYADNCAKIFTSLDYSRCEKYFDDLFSWIEDLNRNGADEIFEYLSKAPGKLILPSFKKAIEAGLKRNNQNMVCFLKILLKENLELFNLLKNDDILKRLTEK